MIWRLESKWIIIIGWFHSCCLSDTTKAITRTWINCSEAGLIDKSNQSNEKKGRGKTDVSLINWWTKSIDRRRRKECSCDGSLTLGLWYHVEFHELMLLMLERESLYRKNRILEFIASKTSEYVQKCLLIYSLIALIKLC